jgi:hypothetical protein
MKITIVEGTTAKRAMRLTDDGSAVPAIGLNPPTLILTDKDGQPVSAPNATEWISAAGGTFNVLLATLTLSPALSPYRARVRLTDGDGLQAFYPDTEDGDEWIVVPQ